MMEVFGSWPAYRAAPAIIVEEQKIRWRAQLTAQSEAPS